MLFSGLEFTAVFALIFGVFAGGFAGWFLRGAFKQDVPNPNLDKELAFLQEQVQRLEAENKDLLTAKVEAETLLGQAKSQEAELRDVFKAVGQETLSAHLKQLTEMTQLQAEQRNKSFQESFAASVKPVSEMIEAYQKRIKEIETEYQQETTTLKTQITELIKHTQEFKKANQNLTDALSNSKGRGDWGEFQLENILHLSGLREGIDYDTQQSDRGLRPDITVNLPNGHKLFVDAKTILIDLQRLRQTDSPEEQEKHRKAHYEALLKEINSLSDKAYHRNLGSVVDFVVLYLPTESMLEEALLYNPTLSEEAFRKGVILATPIILMTLLKVVADGWRQVTLNEYAKEMEQLGKELHKRLVLFLTRFFSLRKAFNALASGYEDACKSLQGKQGVLPQLQKIEQLGYRSDKVLDSVYTQEPEPIQRFIESAGSEILS